MAMSKKHYEALAELVANIDQNGAAISTPVLAERLADVLAADSPRFDRGRFLRAALPFSGTADVAPSDPDALRVGDRVTTDVLGPLYTNDVGFVRSQVGPRAYLVRFGEGLQTEHHVLHVDDLVKVH